MKMLEIVKNNKAKFSFYRSGMLYYDIINNDGKVLFVFPIDIFNKEDIGNATFSAEYKAITLMRYIRKAKENDTLIQLP
jgi:hypothetical protein